MSDQDIYGGIFGSGVGLSLAPRSNVNGTTLSGDGVTKTFVFSNMEPIVSSNPNSYDVIIHGVGQVPVDDYTIDVDANSITFLEAPPAGTRNIYIRIITQAVSETESAAVTVNGYLTANPQASPVPRLAGIGGPFNDQAQALLNNFALLSGVVQVASYEGLRAYEGSASAVQVTGYLVTAKPSGIAGLFVVDNSDTISADNGGTTIVDTQGRRWKRVYNPTTHVEWFGAKGDGVTDDSAAIQAAINKASAIKGTVEFDGGKTYLCKLVYLKPYVSYKGNGCTILKTPANGEVATVTKWWRVFTTQESDWANADYAKHQHCIDGFIFDGNRSNMGWDGGYSQEQAHCLFITGNSTLPVKMRWKIDNCHFRESVADGLSQYVNTILQIGNKVSAETCFRGGLVVTGGYSETYGSMITDDSGIDFEYDGAGYAGRYDAIVQMDSIQCGGDFDFGLKGGVAILTNVYSQKSLFNMAGEGEIKVIGGRFAVGVYSSTGNRVVNVTDLTFTDTTFVITEQETPEQDRTFAGVHVYWGTATNVPARVKLNNPKFIVDPSVEASDTVYAVYCEATPIEADINKSLEIIGGDCPGNVDVGVHFAQGGSLVVRNFANAAASAYSINGSATRPCRVDFGGEIVRGTPATSMFTSLQNQPTNVYTFRDVHIDEAQNKLVLTGGVATTVIIGSRVIYGTAAPTASTHGLKGDVYRLKTPVAGSAYEWVCTTSGTTAAVWKVSKTLAA